MDVLWSGLVMPAFATFFVIIDPVGLVPMFVTLTRHMAVEHRRRTAWRAVLLAFAVLVVFALFGRSVLHFLGITLPAFRIAGGILLLLLAVEMLFEKRAARRKRNVETAAHAHEAEADETDDLWVFPLGIPLLAGPGAITSVILLMGAHAGKPAEQAIIIAVLCIVLAVSLALFLLVTRFDHLINETAARAISRILGMILAALAVQFVLTGLSAAGIAGIH